MIEHLLIVVVFLLALGVGAWIDEVARPWMQARRERRADIWPQEGNMRTWRGL